MTEANLDYPSPTYNQEPQDDALYCLLNGAGRSIPYRPVLQRLTGDMKAAVLLQQVIFHYINMGHRSFYKFVEPCEHPLYREGDSWTEELGFSPDEYKEAIKKISTRVKRKQSREALSITVPTFGPDPDGRKKNCRIMTNRTNLIVYWREADSKLVFTLNETLLRNAVNMLQELAEVEIPLQDSGISKLLNRETPASYNIENFKENTKKQGESCEPAARHNLGSSDFVLEEVLEEPEKETDALDNIIAEVWETNAPGMVQSLKDTLLGQHAARSKHGLCNIEPPATAEELLRFGHYYREQNPNGNFPIDPAKIQYWIYKFRATVSYETGEVMPSGVIPPLEHFCDTGLELLLSRTLEWPSGPPSSVKRELSQPMKYEDRTMANTRLPAPNTMFENETLFRDWVVDKVLPWYIGAKAPPSTLAGALRNYDWYIEYYEKKANHGHTGDFRMGSASEADKPTDLEPPGNENKSQPIDANLSNLSYEDAALTSETLAESFSRYIEPILGR